MIVHTFFVDIILHTNISPVRRANGFKAFELDKQRLFVYFILFFLLLFRIKCVFFFLSKRTGSSLNHSHTNGIHRLHYLNLLLSNQLYLVLKRKKTQQIKVPFALRSENDLTYTIKNIISYTCIYLIGIPI